MNMMLTTLGDVGMTWLAQLILAAFCKDWLWAIKPWSARTWTIMEAAAIIMSVSVEAYALATGRWAYTPSNPRIPGTSVSVIPVLQLMLLFPITFALWRRLHRI
ncbi:MAG: hypothetical protein HY646_20780 [Acidobacteria bacterium]|nr:hypothetical protein [Acidobacteriota bacterium]